MIEEPFTVATPRFVGPETIEAECVYCGEVIVQRPIMSSRWVHDVGRASRCTGVGS